MILQYFKLTEFGGKLSYLPGISKLVSVAGSDDCVTEFVYLASCDNEQLPRTNFLPQNLLV